MSELLDVVDCYGEPAGQAMEYEEVHALGVRHRDVHVWITNGRDVLQQQRTMDTNIMPGAWDVSAAGHVSAGETYLEAGIREAQEELGFVVPPKRYVRIGRVATQLLLPGWKRAHNVVGDNFVVVARGLAISDLRLQEEEVLDARWYPISRLEADLAHPDTRQLHAPQPEVIYALGIAGMYAAAADRF